MITMNEQQQTRSENSSSTELSARKVGAGSAALVAAMMVVNAINFGVNIWLASVLAPGTFGDISLMVTLLLISGVLASMLQLTTCVATMDPTRDATRDVGAMRLLTNRIGLAGAVALMIAAPQLTTLLNIGNAWALLIMAAGLPVHLQLAVERGRLHGELAFGKLTATFLAEGATRALATAAAVLLINDLVTLTLALNAGFVVSYWVCRPELGRLSWLNLSSPAGHPELRSTSMGLIAVTLLVNVDLIIAKVAFDPVTAGGFAALTLAGRIIFFGSWTIQQTVLPLVNVEDGQLGRSSRRRLFLVGNGLLCAVLVAAAWLGADIWVDVVYGSAYENITSLVGPYALGTALIAFAAGVAMLATLQGNSRPAVGLLLASVVLGGAMLLNSESLQGFVIARNVTLALAFITIGVVAVTTGRNAQRRIGSRRLGTRGLST